MKRWSTSDSHPRAGGLNRYMAAPDTGAACDITVGQSEMRIVGGNSKSDKGILAGVFCFAVCLAGSSVCARQQLKPRPVCKGNSEPVQGVGTGDWTYGAAVTLYVSPSGSDARGNGSPAAPYATIRRALQEVPTFVSQSYILKLAPGTYFGEVDLAGRYFAGIHNQNLQSASIEILGSTAVTPVAPTLDERRGAPLGAMTYYVEATNTNCGGETAPSVESSLAVAAGNLLTVTSPRPSRDASGYDVYVATSSGAETRQNSSPIPIGTDRTEPATGLASGPAPPATNTMGDAYVLSGATPGKPGEA